MQFIDILVCWFNNACTVVRWDNALSRCVPLSAGVRQGGVLSPVLFAVYVNDILVQLQRSKLGCQINSMPFNSLLYADDILLLTISVCDMQKMIDLCKTELDWLDMRINSKKSSCIRIGKKYKSIVKHIVVDQDSISWSNEIRYLGVYIVAGKAFRCNVQYCKVKYFRNFNSILGKIGCKSSEHIITSLVSSFSLPALFFGTETVFLIKHQQENLANAYNSIFMKIYGTFNKPIITLCQYYSGYLPFKYLLDAINTRPQNKTTIHKGLCN